jgi:transcriptional regulator with XRE-family HTH domain
MRQLREIGKAVRAARLQRGFACASQLADLVGVDRRRLSELELGKRPLDRRAMARLADLLGIPKLSVPSACSNGKGSRQAEALYLRLARVSRPQYDPPRDREQDVRRVAAWREEPALMEWLNERYRERPDATRVEEFLNSISSASWLEYLYPARELVHPQAVPLRIAPNEIGYCHYALVDPETFAAVGDRLWPALGIRRHGRLLIQFFNATVRTPKRTWTVDILQYSRRRGQSARWTVIEIDGDGHRSRWDLLKEEQIGLPTLRLSSQQVRSDDVLTTIERWLGP